MVRYVHNKQRCTNQKLVAFGRKHFTYINAFLGDQTVRDIIVNDVKIIKNSPFQLYVENDNDDFEEPTHHVLKDVENFIHCSLIPSDKTYRVYYGFQDISINKRDTLCQSYSLLLYYGILQKYEPNPSNPESHKQIQMEMIKLYRSIINDIRFKQVIIDEGILSKANRENWVNIEHSVDSTKLISGNANILIRKLNETLDEWELYGYLWFTGDSTCPITKCQIRKNMFKKRFRDNNTCLNDIKFYFVNIYESN